MLPLFSIYCISYQIIRYTLNVSLQVSCGLNTPLCQALFRFCLHGFLCGNEMKIINLISDPDVMERLFRHPGLWKQHQHPFERKTKAAANGSVVMEDFDHALA
jgi:hypothetical protein